MGLVRSADPCRLPCSGNGAQQDQALLCRRGGRHSHVFASRSSRLCRKRRQGILQTAVRRQGRDPGYAARRRGSQDHLQTPCHGKRSGARTALRAGRAGRRGTRPRLDLGRLYTRHRRQQPDPAQRGDGAGSASHRRDCRHPVGVCAAAAAMLQTLPARAALAWVAGMALWTAVGATTGFPQWPRPAAAATAARFALGTRIHRRLQVRGCRQGQAAAAP